MENLKVPTTMMTQHPDACKYISIQEEPEEAIFSLTTPPQGLGLEEVMVDFEGKLTPYQQTSQVVLGLLSKGVIPGKDVFVTPRIPSGLEEGVFRQLMALMSIIESNYHAWKQSKVYAVREVILPMTTGAEELLSVKERVIDVIELAHKEFGLSKDPHIVELIPLMETIPQIFEVKSILRSYLNGCKKRNLKIKRLRYMLGRSDLALSYGLVTSVLSNKIAISQGCQIQKETGVKIFPILGGGTLPFRGHFSLENVNNTLKEYRGVRTLTLQSAMRYDHGYNRTRKLAKILKEKLGKTSPLYFDEETCQGLLNIIGIFAKNYLHSFYLLMGKICNISDFIPASRDRLARKSEVGYARDVPHPQELAKLITDNSLAKELEKIKHSQAIELPRAISYTAALYSIGLPPEIIGTGRGLNEVAQRYGKKVLQLFLNTYPSLKEDLKFACRYVHLENASKFLDSAVISQIEEDLKFIWQHLGIKIGPQTKKDRFYTTILETLKPMLKQIMGGEEGLLSDRALQANLVKEWILKLGRMRGGLG